MITQASTMGLDIILDPKSHAAAFVGGFTSTLGALPWGLGRQSALSDFAGGEGMRRADEIAAFVLEHDISAVLAPTHLVSGPNDPWFDADRRVAMRLRSLLPGRGLFYSLAVPMQALRDADLRAALVEGLRGVDVDALWLKVENFGADATGDKVRAYIEAVTDFHALGIPVVADHASGIPALALMAFGGVGGAAHGVMMLEGFKASSWKRPTTGTPRLPAPRAYVHGLDLLVPKADAARLIEHSTRVRAQHVCRDPQCCPRGYRDMLDHPVRHYLHRRTREIEALSATPFAVRPAFLMENSVRPRSDALAAAAALDLGDEGLARSLAKKNRHMGRLRGALANLADGWEPQTIAQAPLSRPQREDR